MRLISTWRTVIWRSAANWTVSAVSFVIGAFLQWHMAMFAFLAFLPWLPVQILAGGVVLAVLIAGPTILARITDQPGLQAKIEEKRDDPA